MATILLLDDDDGLRVMLEQTLRMSGHTVIAASNGTHAADKVKAQHVDLLITDLFMPDKEGLEVIEELRGLYPKLPIIAMSGGGAGHEDFFLEIAQKIGANCILSKPFTIAELRKALDEALP